MTSHYKLGGTYKTRDGRSARVICVDAAATKPLIALVAYTNGREEACQFSADGRYGQLYDSEIDLMPRTKEVTRWVNVYPRSWMDGIHETQEEADRYCAPERVACIPITFTIPDDEGSDGK